MKRVLALMMVMLIAFAPMSFAACKFCELADSDSYFKAFGGKLGRGIANAAFGWVELFRQPAINENPWEGVGRGFVHTITRTGTGVLEVATSPIPQVKIPVPDPSCPLELLGSESDSSSKASK